MVAKGDRAPPSYKQHPEKGKITATTTARGQST